MEDFDFKAAIRAAAGNKLYQPEAEPLIHTSSVTKIYGGKERVSGVSLNVFKGEIYGLIGKNGAGKTTLIRLILGLAAPDRGHVEIDGETRLSALPEKRRNIGALIEQPAFYPFLSAYDNLAVYSKTIGCHSPEKIKDLLDFVGLGEFAKKKVKTFSLGMKQRLALATALVGDPQILFLDEPVNGLDPTGILQIREQIKFLNEKRGVTVVISSHLLGELGKVATAYGVMRDGKLVREIRGEALASLARPCLRIVVGDMASARRLLAEKYSEADYALRDNNTVEIFRDYGNLTEISSMFLAAGIPVLQLSVEQGDSEAAFVAMM